MSKSVGNVVDPFVLVKDYGVDQLRYFLLREVPFGQDGNYSREGIVQRINADLANDLGNLAQRSLSMIAKNCGGARARTGRADRGRPRRSWLPPMARCSASPRRSTNSPSIARWRSFGRWSPTPIAISPGEEPWAHKKTNPEADGDHSLCHRGGDASDRHSGAAGDAGQRGQAARSAWRAGKEDRDFAALRPKGRLTPGTELPPPQAVFPRHVEAEETPAA